ncbi:MAG: sensor histidine kinase [Solirubrobacteraceae bacterium]
MRLLRNRELARRNRELEQRNRELELASEAKNRFVATLSHELRTPLNAVIGFSELLHEGRLGPLSDSHHEHIGIIRSSAEHLLALLNETLDMAQIEAGHIRIAPEEVRPAAIAAECVASLRQQSAEQAIEVHLDARAGGAVVLDPARLRQVILNYVANAIKFAGPGGAVAIGIECRGDRLRVEVSDTGAGIDHADQDRVFQEFVALPGTRRTGSGLGLAITKRIVEAQGGEVGVRSAPGRGSTFYASLPAPAPVPAPAPAPAARPRRVPTASPVQTRELARR